MSLTLADFFCGAGGSSTGALMVPGITLRAAANHWDRAIETHAVNHPDADHIHADISQYEPSLFPRTDLGWFSPSCTKHSVAQGKKIHDAQPDLFGEVLPDAAAERSRATMWDVVRFTEYHAYEAVIVENVVEVTKWPPYTAWLAAMDSLGYDHQLVMLNSMHAQLLGPGAPQSRDRFYCVFWRKGNRRPDLHHLTRPHAVCPTCGPVRAMQSWKKPDNTIGKYRSQYVYRCPNVTCRNAIVEPIVRPAADIIDWTLEGQRIGDRARPLADKTMKRIQAGIDRYWAPLLVPVEGRDGKVARPTDEPMRTATARNETGFTVPCGGTWRTEPASLADPLPTRTTVETDGLAFLAQFRERNRLLDPHTEPLTTVVADGAGQMLVRPSDAFIAELRGGGSTARPVTDPLATVTASGNHHGLVARHNEGGTVDIDDVRFRMLEPSEYSRAMDFPADYRMLGTRREQVRLAGNAVTPPAARDLISVVAESLGVVA
ncbi:DNA methyltransferase [Gordonia sp. QH-12]|uniref:DNA cytosine methyltransferase n=1 Tax=Gordonia sp. QH-12 TaxID=1437876 RepID=UPI0007813243|nr:DNA cytosine methyltransferase [Gordonia sp. QH-12]KXT55586.1 DNA methyltransferase [Gordonia sp. QH-12]